MEGEGGGGGKEGRKGGENNNGETRFYANYLIFQFYETVSPCAFREGFFSASLSNVAV